jgi:MFS family permease
VAEQHQGIRQTLRGNLRELPSAAWVLVGGSFVNRFGSFVVPFLVLYLTRRGFGVAQAGSAVAAYGAGEVLAGGIGGYLADRLGRRPTIALSTYSSAAAMLMLSQMRVYGAILALAFVAGLVSEARRPASLALLVDLVSPGRRVTVFAVLRLAENLAFAAGIALGGFLANSSFLWLFLGDAASSVVYGTVALAALPEGRKSSRQEERGGYRGVLADRAFVLFLVATLLLAFVYFQQQATLPLHVRDSGLSNADFGLLLSINGLLVLVLELPISSLTMRRPPRQMTALGFLLVGLGFGLTAVAHSLFTLAATVAVWTLGEIVAAPVGYAYVADISPQHMRGRYQGVYGVVFGAGAVVGPALGTFLFAHVETWFWGLCGGIGLASALLVLGIRTARPRPSDDITIVLDEAAEPSSIDD